MFSSTKPATPGPQSIVKVCSHNDEMQATPWTEAIGSGIPMVEIDVILHDGILWAAHTPKDIRPGKTLKATYIDPLIASLEKANPIIGGDTTRKTWQGIFPGAPEQKIYLMIDFKNAAYAAFDALLALLQPMIQRDWLTYSEDGPVIQKPVTIVGTGYTPIERVVQAFPRYIFYDAPLTKINDGYILPDGTKGQWTPEISPVCNSRWLWFALYQPSAATLAKYSKDAHDKGIECRWWGHARWPQVIRHRIWSLQLQAGVDWLNADDLADAAAFWHSQGNARQSSHYYAFMSQFSP